MTFATPLQHARLLQRQGALDAAAQRYAEILRSDPTNTEVLYALAQIACMQERFDDGISLARRSLAIDAGQGRVHNLLGQALSICGQSSEALASFDAAIATEPSLAHAHGNRGDVLAECGRRHEAVESYDRAIALDPGSFANWLNRGAVLSELQRHAEALDSFDRALALEPGHAQTHFNRGNALSALACYEDALAAYESALAGAPDFVDAHHNRGCLLVKLGRYADAVACFEHLLAIAPEHPRAAGELAHCHLFTCDWRGFTRNAGRLEASLANPACIIPPFALLELAVEPQRLLECNARYVAHEVGKPTPFTHPLTGKSPGRLRIAYLGDFNRHPVSFLTASLFERHDRSRFEIIGMALGRDDGSAIRTRLARSFDHFIDAVPMSDEEAARRLHERGVDIAVDLVGHTENARSGILARRPAPVQVNYLGYLGTLSTDVFDYVIGDAIVLPFEQQPFFTERIVHLPDCFMAQDRPPVAPRTLARTDAGLPATGFVFCSFNHSYKIRAPVFAIWMELLREIEGSVLWLLQANPEAAPNLRSEAVRSGVDPRRLVFAPRVDLSAHLDRQRLADLFLDTVPYNAGATAGAALGVGVPIVTCLGTGMVGRMAASMLHAVGLPELVVTSLDAYKTLACALARDPPRLQALRHKLEANRITHPLFDTARLVRHIETAYRRMWETRQRGEPPKPFSIAPIA